MLGVVAHTFNPSTQKADWQISEFKDSLLYIERLCLWKKKPNQIKKPPSVEFACSMECLS